MLKKPMLIDWFTIVMVSCSLFWSVKVSNLINFIAASTILRIITLKIRVTRTSKIVTPAGDVLLSTKAFYIQTERAIETPALIIRRAKVNAVLINFLITLKLSVYPIFSHWISLGYGANAIDICSYRITYWLFGL